MNCCYGHHNMRMECCFDHRHTVETYLYEPFLNGAPFAYLAGAMQVYSKSCQVKRPRISRPFHPEAPTNGRFLTTTRRSLRKDPYFLHCSNVLSTYCPLTYYPKLPKSSNTQDFLGYSGLPDRSNALKYHGLLGLVHQPNFKVYDAATDGRIFPQNNDEYDINAVHLDHYCYICDEVCNNEYTTERHCNTFNHYFNVFLDTTLQWNCRRPAWSRFNLLEMKMCPSHRNGNMCEYSSVQNKQLQCLYVHTEEESYEWIRRNEFRRYMRKAKFHGMFEATSSKLIKNHKDINITLSRESDVTLQDKREIIRWEIDIKSEEYPLQDVYLLYNKCRINFSLVIPGQMNDELQHIDSKYLKSSDHTWKIILRFYSGHCGSFHQSVILDFGSDILISKQFYVEIGDNDELSAIEGSRKELQNCVWTDEYKSHVSFAGYSERDTMLFKRYPMPTEVKRILTQDLFKTETNEFNYKQRMHQLLFIEEFTCNSILSRFSCTSLIELDSDCEEIKFEAKNSGSLFAKVVMPGMMTRDMEASNLFLKKCPTVLISIKDGSNELYEIPIIRIKGLQMNTYSFYLHFSKSSLATLGFYTGRKWFVTLHFKVERKYFCQMHQTLDSLEEIDLLFPNIEKHYRNYRESSVELRDEEINKNLLLSYVLNESQDSVPPFLLEGRLGCGKTESIAKACFYILRDLTNPRILICTNSQSLPHKIIEAVGPRRVMYIFSAHNAKPKLHEMCMVIEDYRITDRITTRDLLIGYDIIITTFESCHCMHYANMKKEFTHIITHDCQQLLEFETISPLSFARPSTRVVISGDRCDIKPEAYCNINGLQVFQQSLFDRLYRIYSENHVGSFPRLQASLQNSDQFSSEPFQYCSEVFYSTTFEENYGLNKTSLKSFEFYPYLGTNLPLQPGFSYTNLSEKDLIFDILSCLIELWPEDCGELESNDICIVVSYQDQFAYLKDNIPNSVRQYVNVETASDLSDNLYKVVIALVTVPRYSFRDGPPTIRNKDLGFLNNKRLFHAVLSRVTRYLKIIGDPYNMCELGSCQDMWRDFINRSVIKIN